MNDKEESEFHILVMDYRGAAPQHAQGAYEALLEWMAKHEAAIRDDECAAIMSGCRVTRYQTMHDYLEKRIAKRAKKLSKLP